MKFTIWEKDLDSVGGEVVDHLSPGGVFEVGVEGAPDWVAVRAGSSMRANVEAVCPFWAGGGGFEEGASSMVVDLRRDSRM